MNIIKFFTLYGQLFDCVKIIMNLSRAHHPLDKTLEAQWSNHLTTLQAYLQGFKQITQAHITSIPANSIDFISKKVSLSASELQQSQDALQFLQGLWQEPLLGDALKSAMAIRDFLVNFFCQENKFILKCQQLSILEIKTFLEELVDNKKQDIDDEEKHNYMHLLAFLNKYHKVSTSYVTSFEKFYGFLNKPEHAVKACLHAMYMADANENIFMEEDFHASRLKCERTIKLLSMHITQSVSWIKKARIMEVALPEVLRFSSYVNSRNLTLLENYYTSIDLTLTPIDFNPVRKIVNKMEVRIKKINEFLSNEEVNQVRINMELQRREMNAYYKKNHHRINSGRIHATSVFFGQSENENDRALLTAAKHGKIKTLKNSIAKGASLNARAIGDEHLNKTPLIMASCFGHENIVNALIDVPCQGRNKYVLDFRAQDSAKARGYTALHWAANGGYLSIVIALVKADPELLYIQENVGGKTAWHCAIENGHRDVAEYIGLVCMPNLFFVKNNKGQTAFMQAYDKGDEKIIQAIVHSMMTSLDNKNVALREAEQYALTKGNQSRNVIDILLGELSQLDQDLLQAARAGDWDLMMDCLAAGANIKVRDVGVLWGNYGILHHATVQGNVHVVRNLISLDRIKYPVDFLAQTRFGNRNTALHFAAKLGYAEIAELLLNACREALYIREDEFGYTPLHLAIENGNVDIVEMFIAKEGGSILEVPTNNNVSTAFRFAINKGQHKIANIIWDKIVSVKKDYPELYYESLGYVMIRLFLKQYCRHRDNFELIMRNLVDATQQEIIITMDILTVFHNEKIDIFHFFQGGQIHVKDDGHLYKKWSGFKNITMRDGITSHQSDDPQFSIQGSLLSEALIGSRTHKGEKHTWIQTERWSTSLLNFPGHGFTYLKYAWIYQRKWNYGPYGESLFVENAPYRSQQKYIVDEKFHQGLLPLLTNFFQHNQRLLQADSDENPFEFSTTSHRLPMV